MDHRAMPMTTPDARPAILLVDDHPPNLLAAEGILDGLGYEIVTATSGTAALECLLARDFVLIILDVHMPDLDGYETAALLRQRERSREVPIIFLTAVYDQPEHTHRGFALGAVDYITKPFDTVVLRAKVRALVSLYLRGQNAEKERSLELERIKDLFLGAVGHDLRNPLSVILMASKLAVNKPCSETSHQRLAERTVRAAARMNHIIEDILDLTRGQFTGGVPVTPARMDLVEMCVAVLAEFRTVHPGRALELVSPVALPGRWDRDRLARVLSNLVGNALQHSVGGPIRVTVADTRGLAVVEVHNEGTPIPEGLQSRLFEPFHRGAIGTSSDGLGLGLYIVHEIVRAHRGRVGVRSTEGEGTLFTVELPKDL
jgi:signal transduction histidine kinase